MASEISLHVVGAAVFERGKCLLTRRSATMSAPLKWEFPGGKIEPGETPREALRREVREELDVEIEVGEHLGRGTGRVGSRRICLDVYAAVLIAGVPRLTEHHELGWFGPDELDGLDWPEADLPILPALKVILRMSQDHGKGTGESQ